MRVDRVSLPVDERSVRPRSIVVGVEDPSWIDHPAVDLLVLATQAVRGLVRASLIDDSLDVVHGGPDGNPAVRAVVWALYEHLRGQLGEVPDAAAAAALTLALNRGAAEPVDVLTERIREALRPLDVAGAVDPGIDGERALWDDVGKLPSGRPIERSATRGG